MKSEKNSREMIEALEKIFIKNNLKPLTVLDLGCGKFPYLSLFGKQTKINLWDINFNIVLHKKIEKNPNLHFSFVNLNEINKLPEVDLVISSLVFHFLRSERLKILMKEIEKSSFFLLVEFEEKKINENLLTNFNLLDFVSFETPLEKHDGLPEHKHQIIIRLFSHK